MSGQKKYLEEKDRILSPEKLSSMMDISKKRTGITAVFLLLIVLGVYYCLFTCTLDESVLKKVFYEGIKDREQLFAYLEESDSSIQTRENMQYTFSNTLGFSEGVDEYSVFSTVMSRREYDRLAPVLGAEITVDGRVSGKVSFIQSFNSYRELYHYGYTDESLREMNTYPGEDYYYLLSILSEYTDPEMESRYYDSTLTIRRGTLRKLLYVPAHQ